MDWKLLGLVAAGGAAGSAARYAIAGWLTRGDFLWGTLAVYLAGSFLIGAFVFGGLAGGWLPGDARVFLAMGLLGGFTTMSSFTYETVALMEDGAVLPAMTNVAATVVGCLAATWAGRLVGLAAWSGGA